MEKPIESVRVGLTKFTDEIIKRDIAARYMIIMFGVEPEIVLDWVRFFLFFLILVFVLFVFVKNV